MTKARYMILVVEDEPHIRQFLRATLEAENYRVIEAENGQRGLIEAGAHKPDLLILDLGLPDMDGVTLISKIREWSTVPIIVLSARTQETQKIAALDAGADDYITKPFGVGELIARLRVAVRHAASIAQGTGTMLRLGDIDIDLERRHIRAPGREIHLTPIEFRLLNSLAHQAGLVVTHRTLLREVWGPSHATDTHYLRIYMKQLRNKLESDPLQPRYLLTETGLGYRLITP